MVRRGRLLFMVGLVAALCMVGGSAFSADSTDAKREILAMANKLAKAKKFSVTMRMGYDVVQKSGEKIEFGEIRKVIIDRPHYLRVDVKRSDGHKGGAIFNGKTFTQFSFTDKVYAVMDLPDWLDSTDEMIRFAVAEMDIRIPLARMLVTDLPKEIEKLTKEYLFVEKDVLGPFPTNHVAGRTDDVDYQVWIGKDKLPYRIVITYKNEPGQPQFWANFSQWSFNPKTSKATFTFTPPEDFEKIPFVIPVKRTDVAGENKAEEAKKSNKK